MTQHSSDDPHMSPASAAHDGNDAGSRAGSRTAPMQEAESEVAMRATEADMGKDFVEEGRAPQGSADANLPGGGTEPAAGFGDEMKAARGVMANRYRALRALADDPAGFGDEVIVRVRPGEAFTAPWHGAASDVADVIFMGTDGSGNDIWKIKYSSVIRHDLSGVGNGTDQKAQEDDGDKSHETPC